MKTISDETVVNLFLASTTLMGKLMSSLEGCESVQGALTDLAPSVYSSGPNWKERCLRAVDRVAEELTTPDEKDALERYRQKLLVA